MAGPKFTRLPTPRYTSGVSIEEALSKRTSRRRYKDEPLSLDEVAQLLWAAQGMTDPARGKRTAPSAGAMYPIELYLVAGNVDGLAPGVYKYNAREHGLELVVQRDVRVELSGAALGQPMLATAAISIVFAVVYERVTDRYGKRGVRYVDIEVGHAAQNVALQAVPNLGTVVVGAFDDAGVASVLGLPEEERPLYIMPVGRI